MTSAHPCAMRSGQTSISCAKTWTVGTATTRRTRFQCLNTRCNTTRTASAMKFCRMRAAPNTFLQSAPIAVAALAMQLRARFTVEIKTTLELVSPSLVQPRAKPFVHARKQVVTHVRSFIAAPNAAGLPSRPARENVENTDVFSPCSDCGTSVVVMPAAACALSCGTTENLCSPGVFRALSRHLEAGFLRQQFHVQRCRRPMCACEFKLQRRERVSRRCCSFEGSASRVRRFSFETASPTSA